MNISLLQLVSKLFSLFIVSCMSIFNIGNYTEKQINIENFNNKLNLSIINTITNYPVIVKYNTKVPSNISTVLTEGVVGVAYSEKKTENMINVIEEKVIQEVIPEVIEKGTGSYGIYVGKLTGYGPDCVGCSGRGYVACKTKDKKNFSLVDKGVYYEDEKFGKARIIAAALTKFPCGTILEITKSGKESFIGVVMDTGAGMVNELAAGNIHMDLAYTSQKDKTVFAVDGLLGSNITFSVQRWGW